MKPLADRDELHHHSYNSTAANGDPVIEAAFKKEIDANLHDQTVQNLTTEMQQHGWQFWNAKIRSNRLHIQYKAGAV